MKRPRATKLLSWALSCAALSFVVWVVPVRDQCWDPQAGRSTKVAVSRNAAGPACVLHLSSGEVSISAEQCQRLQCEPGVSSTLGHARLGWVGALLGLYALGTLAWAARWRALLDLADIELSVADVWRISVEAQAGGVLLPGGIGGDALRVGAVLSAPSRRGAPVPAILVVASVLLDRAIGLGVIAAVAAAMGFAYGGARAGPLPVVLAAIPVGLVVVLATLHLLPVAPERWGARWRLVRGLAPVVAYVRDPRARRAIAVAAGLSLVVALVQFASVRGLVVALDAWPTDEKWIYVGTAMAFMVAAVPALPGGWGTADAAYVFFFGLAGLPAATALGVCLLYRLFWYVFGIVGALLHLTRRRPALA